MGGGSGGGGTTVNKTEPWDEQKGYLSNVFEGARILHDTNALSPDYYPGQTYAGMDGATYWALEAQQERAMNGSSALRSSHNLLDATTSGEFLNNNPFENAEIPGFLNTDNPYLDAMTQRAVAQANAGVAGNAAASGRYGSGAFHAAANDAAGNIATQMYGQAYDNDQNRRLSAWQSNQQRFADAWNAERANQMKGLALAPQLSAADYQDLAALAEVGTARENYRQMEIDADIDRHNYDANREYMAWQKYADFINGNYGATQTTKGGGVRSNPLGGAMAGATSMGGLGYMLGGQNYGMAGAGIGGLAGLFGG